MKKISDIYKIINSIKNIWMFSFFYFVIKYFPFLEIEDGYYAEKVISKIYLIVFLILLIFGSIVSFKIKEITGKYYYFGLIIYEIIITLTIILVLEIFI